MVAGEWGGPVGQRSTPLEATVKLEMFHLMPYRELPEDFKEQHRSVWVDIPSDLFDPARAHLMFNDTLDELELAAALGYDGVCVNEHHNNGYGMMPSPNIMAASLARRTENAAIVVMGNSLALYNPPLRVAEEFAMLDCISGGRLVAGFPVGSSMDTNYAYGSNPATLRARYYEAEELVVKAWTTREVFAFDGQFNQQRYVNIWPRPVQQPHPPIWVPGGGSIETWDWTIDKNYLYAYLSYSGYKRGKLLLDGFWKRVEVKNVEPNPYHAGFLQLVAVGETMSEVEERFGPHGEYFYNKMLHVYPGFADAPGYRTTATIKAGLLGVTGLSFDRPSRLSWKDLLDQGNIIAGTPSQVTEQLEHLIKSLRVGHLMLLNQFGSIPHELAMRNIELTATRVLPNLRQIWSEWEDHWWPKPLAERQPAAAVRGKVRPPVATAGPSRVGAAR
jgi:alkanesulfonate monooxygenase SsuD/methylene tetrahydromethanopterin reductase-like flavin-dependent oxidoreductase (luciferase family)